MVEGRGTSCCVSFSNQDPAGLPPVTNIPVGEPIINPGAVTVSGGEGQGKASNMELCSLGEASDESAFGWNFLREVWWRNDLG